MYSCSLKRFPSFFNSSRKRNYCREVPESILNVLKNSAVGDEVNIKGWVKSLRKQKENVFIDLNDGSTGQKLQVIIPQNLFPKNVSPGASISASGLLKSSPKGQIELNANEIKIYGECVIADGYPFSPKKWYAPEYIRQYLHLRPRINRFASLMRTRSTATFVIHEYLQSEGYINVHTPILTSNDCEGAGEIFRVIPESKDLLKSMVKEGESIDEAFFNTKTFLTVSGQLHLEAAAHGLNKVYSFGPTFRAENSRSRLHLAEFYMLEAEVAFLEDMQKLLSVIENLLKNVTKLMLDRCENDINSCQEEKPDFNWLNKNFPILTYDESVNILKDNQPVFSEGYKPEEGISKEHELFLVKHCGNVPVFIINWPKNIKPFYMRECQDDRTKVQAVDLLVPGIGEIVGGSLRETDCEKIRDSLTHNNSQLDWYFDLRKYGGVPTGGYGLGFERYLLFITGLKNIKDVIPFPRWPHNCNM
ncbi:asparagine--tRNA ligase, mitochondrial [Leptinotarsa decemlineata]|uniref:asparagine--tRNA ligase, mitochondrial n=1 Tax=Leptinotarsa decemlineata TaxID=7539 RepID=UPI003D30BCE1